MHDACKEFRDIKEACGVPDTRRAGLDDRGPVAIVSAPMQPTEEGEAKRQVVLINSFLDEASQRLLTSSGLVVKKLSRFGCLIFQLTVLASLNA